MTQFGEREDYDAESDGRWKKPKWKPTLEKPIAPTRCTAINEKGFQCANTSYSGELCGIHASPQDLKTAQQRVEAARLRMVGLVEPAIDVLEELIKPGVADAVRLKAVENIFDRAGIHKGAELNVTVENVSTGSKMVLDKMAQIRNRQQQEEEIVDVEEVDENGD